MRISWRRGAALGLTTVLSSAGLVRFARYPNYLATHIVAGLLENEGVPTLVEFFAPFPVTDSSAIWVPKELLHRARWILAWPPPTEAELLFLATGEFLSADE